MHARIAERIALIADIANDDVVFEIGPGTGMLTRALLPRAKKVIAIEADRVLFEKLKSDFVKEISNNKLELIHGDIRSFDIASLPKGYVLVSNIPYYLTGDIFRMFLESKNQPSSMTLLVQKEVADRIVARDGKESILSLSVKVYGVPKREFIIPRGAFVPAPKVDSAVLTVRDISRRNFKSHVEEDLFFKLIHAGFAHKRKFVRKNLLEAGLPYADIPEKGRAEDTPLGKWLEITSEKNQSSV